MDFRGKADRQSYSTIEKMADELMKPARSEGFIPWLPEDLIILPSLASSLPLFGFRQIVYR